MKKSFLLFALVISGLLANSQNVGIGTATPGYKLDILGRVRVQAATVNNVNTSAGIWHTDYRTNSDMVFAGMVDSVNYGLYSNKAGIGWEFFFDARYGNIGVGRKPSSGVTKLVLDDPDGAGIGLYSNGSYRGGVRATDSTLQIFSLRSGIVCAPAPCSPPPAKDIIFWPPSNCTGIGCIDLTAPGRIGYYLNSPNARIHVAAGTGVSGVLIGNGASLPATGYMLNVDGKIICEELKVQLSTSWPDYVFEETYKMPSLLSLEEKVMQEKHLPGIPSAADVKSQQGIEMGDMQKRLLEKVEELYRYTFELNQKNILLEKKIAYLETALSK